MYCCSQCLKITKNVLKEKLAVEMYQNSLLRVIARCKVGLKLFNVIRS